MTLVELQEMLVDLGVSDIRLTYVRGTWIASTADLHACNAGAPDLEESVAALLARIDRRKNGGL